MARNALISLFSLPHSLNCTRLAVFKGVKLLRFSLVNKSRPSVVLSISNRRPPPFQCCRLKSSHVPFQGHYKVLIPQDGSGRKQVHHLITTTSKCIGKQRLFFYSVSPSPQRQKQPNARAAPRSMYSGLARRLSLLALAPPPLLSMLSWAPIPEPLPKPLITLLVEASPPVVAPATVSLWLLVSMQSPLL